MTFWRWLTTSRYTRSLEEQVTETKKQLEFISAQGATLNHALIAAKSDVASLDQQLSVAKQQAADLKADLRFERDQVSQLTVKLVEAAQATTEANGKAAAEKDKKPLQLGNWLRTRAQLESQDQVVREPDKEN